MIKGLEKYAQQHRFIWTTIGIIVVLVVGVADYLSGKELAFSLFYLLPILLVTWFSGRTFGILISLVAAVTWSAANWQVGHEYPAAFIPYWNAAVRLGFFLVVPLLLPALRALEREKEISRVDYLTGAANRRHFYEAAQTELDRCQRYKHPFTIAYFDLDGFKAVNDRFGHRTGDKVLCAIVNRLKILLRKTDLLARIGGDEFVFLLPEIDSLTAKVIVPKIQASLLNEMERNNWPVTFSIGVLSYVDGSISTEAFIKQADDLMYSVKNNGKNDIAYAIYSGQAVRAQDVTSLRGNIVAARN